MACTDVYDPEDVPASLKSSPVQHDDDIDKAFDSLILIESIYQKKGYEQGSAVATERDQKEGFILGVKKGFEIGSEVGFFQSFAQVWIKLVQAQSEGQNKKNQKVKSELEKLAQLAAKASGQNSKDDEIWQSLRQMRSKYTLICKLLKLQTVDSSSKDVSW